MVYMLGAKHVFAQSMDCAAQIMDPYFARAIHGLRSRSVCDYAYISIAHASRKVGMRCGFRARTWLV